MIPNEEKFEHLRFDPTEGEVIRSPTGNGYGYWAGGHKVHYDEASGQFVLFYRLRTPLEKERGGECAVATSRDGIHFDDVWTATKADFAASSIEVGHAVRTPNGGWRLYVCYELANARFWRIDMIEADEPSMFETQSRRTVLQPGDYGLRSIKDPVVYVRDGKFWIYSVGPGVVANHSTQPDILSARGSETTYLGISDDGVYFPELRVAFKSPGTDTWHGRRARINSCIPYENGYLGFYDGGRTSYDTYEEWCGLAWSENGLRFERLSQDRPWLRSPWGCVRYVYALWRPDAVYFYYEYTREDGAHDLRIRRVATVD